MCPIPRQVFQALETASNGRIKFKVKLVGACDTWFMQGVMT